LRYGSSLVYLRNYCERVTLRADPTLPRYGTDLMTLRRC
jgi:hypothetical protein